MRTLARLNRVMDNVKEDLKALQALVRFLALRQDKLFRRYDEIVEFLNSPVPYPAETLSGVGPFIQDVLHDSEKGNHRGAPSARGYAADTSLGPGPRDDDVLSGHGRFPFSEPFRTGPDPRKGVGDPTSGVNTQRSLEAFQASRRPTEAPEVTPGPKTKSNSEIHSLVDPESRRGGRPE